MSTTLGATQLGGQGRDDTARTLRPAHRSPSVTARVREAYRRIAEVDRPEVWISLLPQEDAIAAAEQIDRRLQAGEELPLAGVLLAVKDNIDVAGFDTTAACPTFAYRPSATATAVRRLVDTGGLVLGKTNLDQFATGLVGTRSPYGAVRNAYDPDLIAGGSSSGSAVAVALGIVDIGVGTDTAGSGRVPPALNRIVGIKPSRGLVPTTGVVPAARPYDCVTVMARSLPEAGTALRVMIGPDQDDPRSRTWPPDVRLGGRPRPRVAVPRAADLEALDQVRRRAFARTVERLQGGGAETAEIDLTPFLSAAKLLYESALAAERHAAVGDFIDGHLDEVDPIVGAIIHAAGKHTASALAAAQDDLAQADAVTRASLEGFDALLLPTTPSHPTIAEVGADPVDVNSYLGTYTNFVNLLDLAAVAVPVDLSATGGPGDAVGPGESFGVSLITRAFDDQVGLDLAGRLLGTDPGPCIGSGIEIVAFGAHMRGGPLEDDLATLGAVYVDDVETTKSYRMVALPTQPPKPGVVATEPERGAALSGERWLLPAAGLGHLLASLSAPLSLGSVDLADGSQAVGFLCDTVAASQATDITAHGGWRAYLNERS